MDQLIIATANKKKFKEIKKILGKNTFRIKYLLDFKERPRIVESGRSFFENARIKAIKTSLFYDSLALGEDSGLQVLALGGRPGIFSSRFAGKTADDKKNIDKLLKELKGVAYPKRKARFFCCAVLAYKGKVVGKFEGSLQGFISFKTEGGSGFGYDPVFFVPELKKTLAQVPPKVKNRLSHRYKAISKFSKFLRNYLERVS
ncbi:MAG: RdgB/HAM1 family non-canonical purine NTP pyrophosphatase [Candidatus Omnitrophica bacterium]|nr:RdgB/HAM1 family non-canonical purine NTP pyrophosphatase [Candidatus Omnitrophota bacterium]